MIRRRFIALMPALAGAACAARALALEPPRPADLLPLIRGTWAASGEAPAPPGGRGLSWFMEWTFQDGRFRQHGYPPIAAEGRYRALGVEGGALLLDLVDEKGNFAGQQPPRRLTVQVLRQGEDVSLVINGTAFKRKWIEKRG